MGANVLVPYPRGKNREPNLAPVMKKPQNWLTLESPFNETMELPKNS